MRAHGLRRLGATAAIVVAGVSLAAAVGSAAGGPGSLDPSFGGGGWSSAGFPTLAGGVAVQPDRKVLVAGGTSDHRFGVGRITTGGRLR